MPQVAWCFGRWMSLLLLPMWQALAVGVSSVLHNFCAVVGAAELLLQYLKSWWKGMLCRWSLFRCAFVEVARPLQFLKSYLPPHCLMVCIQLKYTPLLLGPIVHRRCHYSSMAFCCCCQSLFRCALTEAAALPLQYLKSHDALAGGCCYSCFGRWLCLYCVSGMLIVLDAIVVYMTLAIWVSCRWKCNVEHLSLFVFERVRCMNKQVSLGCVYSLLLQQHRSLNLSVYYLFILFAWHRKKRWDFGAASCRFFCIHHHLLNNCHIRPSSL